MARRYASNVKISAPIAVNAQADVDFNGIQFSYTLGLMFPSQASMQESVWQAPATVANSSIGGLGINK
jgi:hypothetical protein